ncbi:MAG: metal ABC transporter permease [Flavobacteriales bacterium]|jgi:manganese/zinc/iron transport system permease protein|nr:metal ABC transporter permease [Flavobacteriales bacterium]
MEIFDQNFWWIFLSALLIAIPNAILGSFLILRKMAMIGDAISHAVLPGIVIAYIFTQNYQSIWMLIAAAGVGVLAAVMIESFNKFGRLQEDASIGVTYTWLFASGVVLISWFNDDLDIDQDCVLFGEIAYLPLDLIQITDQLLIPNGFLQALFMFVVVISLVLIFYKGLFITSFDESYAISIGVSAVGINYVLMSLVSFVTVFSFDAVGAILVLALMVVPSATAYLLSENLKKMLFLSSVFAVTGVFFGYLLAVLINGSIAGAIASILGLQFLMIFLLQLIFSKKRQKQIVSD